MKIASAKGHLRPTTGRFFYGWVIVFVAAMGVFFSGPGQTYGVSVFIDPMMESFGWSRSLISSLYSTGTLIAGFALTYMGRILDRVGGRRMLTIVPLLFGVACMFMSSISGATAVPIGFILIRFLGQGSMTLIPSTLVPQWFIKKRGRALSVTTLGGVIATAVLPLVNTWLIASFGWRVAWQVWAVLLWAVMAPVAWFFVRDRPEDVGLMPDGEPETEGDKESQGQTSRKEFSWTLSQARRVRAFWFLLFCIAIPAMVNTGITFHQISLLGVRGISVEVAAFVLSLIAIVQVPFNFIGGYVADRVPIRYIIAGTQTGWVVVLLWLTQTDSASMALAFGVIRGMFAGFEAITGSVVWANYFGRQHLGSIRGVTMTVTVVASALGPILFGVAYDVFGGYNQVLLLMILFPLLGILAALLSPPPKVPGKQKSVAATQS